MRYAFAAALLAVGLVAPLPAADEPPEEMVKMVIDLLHDKDKDLRAAGLDQVRTEVRGATATQRFAAELPKLSPEAQMALLSALAERRDAAARPAVLALLQQQPGEPVQVAALAALGTLGAAADVPVLVQALAQGSESAQAAAKTSLEKLPGDKVNALLVEQLHNAAAPVRAAVIDVLSSRRAYEIAPQFVPGTRDANQAVRMSSMAALARLAGPEQMPALLSGVLAAEPGAEREAAEKAVVAACARNEDSTARTAPVLAAFKQLTAGEQLALLSLLGRLGGEAVLPPLQAALTSGDAERRQAALAAFNLWPDGSIADQLFQVTQTASDPEDRALAFAALVRASALRDTRSDTDRLAALQRAMSLAQTPDEKALVINRCRTAYTIGALRYVMPYVAQPEYAPIACETVVELAHHRELRDPHKDEFDQALDQVLATSKDDVVRERAQRYKLGQTWERPKQAPPKPVDDDAAADDEPAEPAAAPQLSQYLGGAAAGIFVALLALLLVRRLKARG